MGYDQKVDNFMIFLFLTERILEFFPIDNENDLQPSRSFTVAPYLNAAIEHLTC